MALNPRIRTMMLVGLFAAGLAGCAGPMREHHQYTRHHQACPGHRSGMMQGSGMMQESGMQQGEMRDHRAMRRHRRDCMARHHGPRV